MISVILNIYNEPIGWIRKSIESILAQSYRDFELVVVVDNPNISPAVIEYLANQQRKNHFLKIIQNKKSLGLALGRNLAVKTAVGDYLAFMDADDISANDRLAVELEFLIKNNLDVVSSLAEYINEKDEMIGKSKLYFKSVEKILPFANPIFHPSVIIKKESFLSVGGYRSFRKSQDYDLWLRMLSKGFKFGVIDRYLIRYRLHNASISHSNRFNTYLHTKYIQNLYRERKRRKSETDSFNESFFYGCVEKKSAAKYVKKYEYVDYLYEKAKSHIKKRNPIGFILIVKAFFCWPDVISNRIYTTFRCHFFK